MALALLSGTAFAQVLVTALPINPTSLDPHRALEGYSFTVFQQIYDTLVRLAEDGSVEPSLAERWDYPEDGVLRLYLRQGVRFHDGSPLDAQVVAASLRRVVDPATGSRAAFLLTEVADIRVVDEHTIDLVSDPPYLPLLANLTFPPLAIVPLGAGAELGRAPVGTGPFRFVSWREGDEIELVADPGYWGGAPQLAGIRFRVMPERGAQIVAFRAGDLHLIHDPPPDAFHALAGLPDVTTVTFPSDRTTYLEINVEDPLLADPRVRRAFAHALDTELITEALFRGLALPPGGLLSPLVRDAVHEPGRFAYDPDLARALLREAGAEGARLRLDMANDSDLDAVAEVVQASLAAVGVQVTIHKMDFATFFELSSSGDTQLSVGFWGCDTLEPAFTLFAALHSSQVGGNNGARYANPAFDDLLERAMRTPDADARAELYRQAQELALTDLPMVPLYHHVGTYAKRGGLEGERIVASSFLLDLRQARLAEGAGR